MIIYFPCKFRLLFVRLRAFRHQRPKRRSHHFRQLTAGLVLSISYHIFVFFASLIRTGTLGIQDGDKSIATLISLSLLFLLTLDTRDSDPSTLVILPYSSYTGLHSPSDRYADSPHAYNAYSAQPEHADR